ncbi:TPA: hypothetical protein ACHQP4_004296 [Klebsiella aerogenes]|uniref:hypothetical protein n=1 Tax=Klebsiella aerogenes TaxID=548 RepID=UPI00075035A9|nr:hypothetical protein [Klebsiella aerogenes]KUQ07668.1 hypothetical protein AWI08_04155 [Klebsiella aerogenes]HBV9990731.1 hypothetical protein [Klebsiella aerogenes]HEM8667233.1 hypothetical protein [Klebsiella aerogenes]
MADAISVWVPVISTLSGGLLTGGVALLVSRLNHRYAGEREALAAAERHRHEIKIAQELLDKERLFIATELIFLLEQFAEGCARVATDSGEPDMQGEYTQTEKHPELIITNISGDWRTLPPRVMYRVHELPVLLNEVRRHVAAYYDYFWEPPYHSRYYRERQFHYARLGLKAVIQARRLRKLVGLPGTRLDATGWSAQPVLRNVWRKKGKERTEAEIRYRVKNKEDNS